MQSMDVECAMLNSTGPALQGLQCRARTPEGNRLEGGAVHNLSMTRIPLHAGTLSQDWCSL